MMTYIAIVLSGSCFDFLSTRHGHKPKSSASSSRLVIYHLKITLKGSINPKTKTKIIELVKPTIHFHPIHKKMRNWEQKQNHTSTICTFPAPSKSSASWALSTLKGRFPTKSLRSGGKLGSPSSLRTSSSCSKSETATCRTKDRDDWNPLPELINEAEIEIGFRDEKEREESETEVGLGV